MNELEDEKNGAPNAAQEQNRALVMENRLINFAARILRLSRSLPENPAGKHLAEQLLRSGTGPAPCYSEGRTTETREEFIHNMRMVLNGLNEASIWLRIIERSDMIKEELLAPIQQECGELCRIFASSIKTARANSRK
ncbi:MAG: four helix bundle protein [Blastocatellia bacterium]|nr:four helix bundle protein [Blastocatellia bacterium]